jgi:two-component system, NtrC family, response regulator GlrR
MTKDRASLPSPDDPADVLARTFVALSLIGNSPAFIETLRFICRFAHCDAPILIRGETGTGKELVARALHYMSPRATRSFVPVNCGALAETLIESELFGHERGAFTDARVATKGLVAQANGGTLLLDEVDSLSSKAQVALLRFLQDHQYRPVGGERLMTANVRIVAASNIDLVREVAAARFRQDLYFRLDVVSVVLPPLRARAGDVPLLAQHFLDRFAASYGRASPTLDPAFLAALATRDWPGNVRELENVMHRAFFAAPEGEACRLADPSFAGGDSTASTAAPFTAGLRAARAQLVREFELRYLIWLMGETRGNVSAAARRAMTARRQLGRLLRRHGIDRERFRDA